MPTYAGNEHGQDHDPVVMGSGVASEGVGGTTHKDVEFSTGYPDGSKGSPAPEEEAS